MGHQARHGVDVDPRGCDRRHIAPAEDACAHCLGRGGPYSAREPGRDHALPRAAVRGRHRFRVRPSRAQGVRGPGWAKGGRVRKGVSCVSAEAD